MPELEKYAFKMKLFPGKEAEYQKRHDEIWPELVTLLHQAGVSDYSIHLDGRQVYVIGNNPLAARFSGIPVERIKFVLFLLTGLMSGIAAVCLTSRLGSTRPSIAQGWELEVVTMVVLGGVSILGGSGTIGGVVIAAFVMGLVTFGLGLLNVPGIVMSIFVGLLLIITIAIPIVVRRLRAMRS